MTSKQTGKKRPDNFESFAQAGKRTQFKSGEQAVKNGRKGGKASGAAKRKKKRQLEAADIVAKRVLNMDVIMEDEARDKLAQALDMDPDELNMMHMMFIGVANGIKKRGDVYALEKLLELSGMGSDGGNSTGTINEGINSLAELINHPLPDRSISQIEDGGADDD